MNVYGVYFPNRLLSDAWDTACEEGLSYRSLQDAIVAQGFKQGEAVSRAADRMLQKKRKAGEVEFVAGVWFVV